MVYSPLTKRLLVSSGESTVFSINISNGKIERLAIQGAKKLTWLVGSENWFYVYDESSSALLKIDNKGKVLSKLKLNVGEGAALSSLQAQPIPGFDGVGIFFTVVEPDGSKSKVDVLFEKYATDEYKRNLNEYVRAAVVREFNTFNPSDSQQAAYIKAKNLELKKGFLEVKLGGVNLIEQTREVPSTHVVIASDGGGKLKVVLDDIVRNFTPDTNSESGLSQTVQPTLYFDGRSGSLLFVVALNRVKAPGGLVKLYQVQ